MINIQSEKINFIAKNKNNLFFKKIYYYIDSIKNNKEIKSDKIYLMVLFKFYLWLKYNSSENIFIEENESLIDLNKYINFLKNPEPKNIFTGMKVKINNYNWKPFNNFLTNNSIIQHLNIIKKFLKFNNIKYLNEDSFKDNMKKQYIINETFLEKIIRHIELKSFNEEKNKISKKIRLKWIIILLFSTGVKIKDVFNIKMNDIKKLENYYFIDIFNKNKINRIKLSDFFIKEFLIYKKQYSKKQLIDKSNFSMILSLSGQIDIKLNTVQKEFLKLKNEILNDLEYQQDKDFLNCIKHLSLIKIREYAILKLIKDNNINKLDLKNFFNIDEQTYKKYLNKYEMSNNLGF